MGVVITVVNQKGGVAKTTTVAALAYQLKQQGNHVLIIDTDSQGSLGIIAGEDIQHKLKNKDKLTLLNVLQGDCDIRDAIIETEIGDLIPSSAQLNGWTGQKSLTTDEYKQIRNDPEKLQQLMDNTFLNEEQKLQFLDKALVNVRKEYDYILIDNNPSILALTLNTIYTCDYVLIPIFADGFSKSALKELRSTVETLATYQSQKQIQLVGLLMTKCSIRTILGKRYVKQYDVAAKQIGTVLFKSQIRNCNSVPEAIEFHENICKYAPKSTAAQDYIAFTKEFVSRIEELEGKKHVV